MNFENAIGTYCALMEDIKWRIAVVHRSLQTTPPILDSRALYELSFLQFRMICELIALGCLVAHGDIKETKTKKMLKEYDAREIIKTLDALNPEFYPRPTIEAIRDGKVVRVLPMSDDYLTKTKLLELYGKCGSILHIGSLKNIRSRHLSRNGSIEIAEWFNRITSLLNHHKMFLLGGLEFWVEMESKLNGRPIGYIIGRL